MGANEWKIKYYELKNKWLDSLEKAHAMGYELGAKEMQSEMEAQAKQEQQMMEQAAMGGAVDENGMPIEDPNAMPPPDMEDEEGFVPPPEEVDPQKSEELDAHINELEQMVAKGEKPSVKDLRKTISNISGIRKSQKDKWTKKVEKTSSAQKKFVDGILAKWSDETKDLTKELEENIKSQGLKLED